MKKIILIQLVLFFSISAWSKSRTFYCSQSYDDQVILELVVKANTVTYVKTADYSLSNPKELATLSDGSKSYEFVVSDQDDTVVSFAFDVLQNKIINKKSYTSGHDTDNFQGYLQAEGDAAFHCLWK